ncbi:MAG: hypothetical protein WC657_09145 [Candidatus Paceibacterota bacterium]|jgi:hypothetical protein
MIYNPHLYLTNFNLDPKEELTGYVSGQKASDLEERSARALTKLEIDYTFRARISPLSGLTEAHENIVGEVEIDFLCMYYGKIYPVNIQGEISHFYASWQRVEDDEKEAKINKALEPYKAHPLVLLPYWRLSTQLLANQTFRLGFTSGWLTKFYED